MLKKLTVTRITEPPTEDAIRSWLLINIASVVNMDPSDLDIRETFDHYGLDSLQAVSLSGDLENWLNRQVSPTVVWDYPTVEQLARHLSESYGNNHPQASSQAQDEAG